MTKRAGLYEEKTCKKSKPSNSDVDNLWGDEDLDVSVIDDCFKLAENYQQVSLTHPTLFVYKTTTTFRTTLIVHN